MRIRDQIRQIHGALSRLADPERAAGARRYLKSDLDFLGVAVPEIRRIARAWLRRAALLALLLPLRRGEGDWKRFARYADRMLEEKEFFIRKAIGWVLREVAKQHPQRVAAFVEARLDRISGVTLREAMSRLPAAESQRLTAGTGHDGGDPDVPAGWSKTRSVRARGLDNGTGSEPLS